MESEPKRIIILWKRDNTSFNASFFLKNGEKNYYLLGTR